MAPSPSINAISQQRTPAVMTRSWDQRRRLMKTMGLDPRENRIDILIGSHFGMGGIRVNKRTETTLPGLFAAGEVMGGVHGGMRLSGYSFTQMIVFGLEAGKQAADLCPGEKGEGEHFVAGEVEAEMERIFHFLKPKRASLSVSQLKPAAAKADGGACLCRERQDRSDGSPTADRGFPGGPAASRRPRLQEIQSRMGQGDRTLFDGRSR